MVPSVLICLISVIGFLLPSESGEKVSLQLTALLSYSIVFLVIVDIIPPVGGNFPLIGNLKLIICSETLCLRTCASDFVWDFCPITMAGSRVERPELRVSA